MRGSWVLSRVGSGFAWLPRTLAFAGRALAGRDVGGLGRGLLAVPPALVALAAAAMVVFLVYSGWLYPLRPDVFSTLSAPTSPSPVLRNAWGGPTLLGAWAAHAAIAVAIQGGCLLILAALHRLRARMTVDAAAVRAG